MSGEEFERFEFTNRPRGRPISTLREVQRPKGEGRGSALSEISSLLDAARSKDGTGPRRLMLGTLAACLRFRRPVRFYPAFSGTARLLVFVFGGAREILSNNLRSGEHHRVTPQSPIKTHAWLPTARFVSPPGGFRHRSSSRTATCRREQRRTNHDPSCRTEGAVIDPRSERSDRGRLYRRIGS